MRCTTVFFSVIFSMISHQVHVIRWLLLPHLKAGFTYRSIANPHSAWLMISLKSWKDRTQMESQTALRLFIDSNKSMHFAWWGKIRKDSSVLSSCVSIWPGVVPLVCWEESKALIQREKKMILDSVPEATSIIDHNLHLVIGIRCCPRFLENWLGSGGLTWWQIFGMGKWHEGHLACDVQYLCCFVFCGSLLTDKWSWAQDNKW